MSDDLGRMSTDELLSAKLKATAGAVIARRKESVYGNEVNERYNAYRSGRAGESAVLSRAQVRAVLGEERRNASAEYHEADRIGDIERRIFAAGRLDQVARDARALLGLPPDAVSPLEEE